jgi:3-methylfumaryl-CoA hydratase
MAGLDGYIGVERSVTDVVTPLSVARLAATLDVDDPATTAGDPLPPGWQCVYFLGADRPGALAPDGLPAETALLPPVPLPRRMFGGARLRFDRPICVGETITRSSTLAAIEPKETRAGPMVRAVLRHVIATPAGPAITEEQDILYLPAADPDAPPPAPRPAPADAAWTRAVTPDAVLLFRYSALTFNTHRIHYDQAYAREAEGYPGLVVQGTLLALLLLELGHGHRADASIVEFAYRAVRPVYDTAPFTVCGRPDGENDGDGAEMWIADGTGALAMSATARFDAPIRR